MFLYFNKQGTLKEIIYDLPFREGSENVNYVYAYFEDENIIGSTYLLDTWGNNERYKSGEETIKFTNNIDGDGVFIGDISLKYFTTNKPYHFHYYRFSDDDIAQAGSGAHQLTIRGFYNVYHEETTVVMAMGLVCLTIEDEVIVKEDAITKSQYDYLLNKLDISLTAHVVVSELPAFGESGVVYLVPKVGTTMANAYAYINNAWVSLGETETKISGEDIVIDIK